LVPRKVNFPLPPPGVVGVEVGGLVVVVAGGADPGWHWKYHSLTTTQE
jgi:non-ribosomal peptide synthetase component E (peptide arylation enzyme)